MIARSSRERRAAGGLRCLLAAIAAFAAAAVAAVPRADGERFVLTGSAALSVAARPPSNERFDLRVTVAPAATSTVAPQRSDRRFELASVLAPASLVCYNDTIFRDGYDGSGL